jgi:hypothetical protein
MIHEFKVQGFPQQLSKELEIPDMAELLAMPFFKTVTFDDFRKHGTDFHRYLADNTPIVGKADVLVICTVQYLYPGGNALHRRTQYPREWHMDYDVAKSGDDSVRFTHLLQSGNDQAFTEFNDSEFTIEVPSGYGNESYQTSNVNLFLNEHEGILPLKAKKMEANKIHTFDSHIHRIVFPKSPHFRFIYRVWETEGEESNPINQGGLTYLSQTGIDDHMVDSIVKEKNRIILNLPKI